jgi:hypothetical protein
MFSYFKISMFKLICLLESFGIHFYLLLKIWLFIVIYEYFTNIEYYFDFSASMI